MKQPDNSALLTLLAAGMIKVRRGFHGRWCASCGKQILPGEGYRQVAGVGYVHGACAKQTESGNAQGQG